MQDLMVATERRSLHERLVLIITPIVICTLIIGGFIAYQSYVQDKIFQEGADHLLTTYEQVDKTFSLFAQRNWNVLSDWDAEFGSAENEGVAEAAIDDWREFAQRKSSWMYSDFYVFNDDCDFLTIEGRQGHADSISGVFTELYQNGEPTISSYTSSDGKRKVVFAALSSSPIMIDGVTYTGLAVSYENEVVEGMMTSNVFGGESDCYVIRGNGDVVLSLSPKTEFVDHIDNMFSYLDSSVTFERGSVDAVRSGVESGAAGSVLCAHDGTLDEIVWQTSGMQGWTIVGVVHESAVNAGMRDVQAVTLSVLTGLFLCAAVLVIGGIVLSSRRNLRSKEAERLALAHQKKLSDELFGGVTKIVDRFAICDLENDTYEYHEHELDHPLYPACGRYQDLIEGISKRYVVTSDPVNVKVGHHLSPGHLREVLKRDDDVSRFEYAGREGDVYKVMTVVPVEWNASGSLKKVLISCQDIGRRVELENITRTDGLTGLFNERCFAEVLHARQETNEPFTLLYLDLDRFKPVNDTYGHDAGDQLLKEVAHRIQSCIRDEDFAFRIGGDEFAIVLAVQMSDDQIRRKAFRVKETICQPIKVDGHVVNVGASCGWARFPFDSTQVLAVRKLADQRMYADKEKNHADR